VKRVKTRIAVVLGVALAAIGPLLWAPAARHVRAADLLARLSDTAPTIAGSEMRLGGRRARRYAAVHPRGVVLLVHGVHARGIDEPRLRRLAGLLAEQRLTVVTPDFECLRTFRMEPRAIDDIASAARALRRREHARPIGVVGISIGGGLSILAALREPAIGSVLAVGAHRDLASLARSWASDPHAERYGRDVLAYAYGDEYFAGLTDAPQAREALRMRLYGESGSRHAIALLSPQARARIEALRSGATVLSAIVARHRAELASVSPAGRTRSMQVPVFLLHGIDDPLVPSTESVRLFRELPEPARGGLVRTRLLSHADVEDTTLGEEITVVHLIANAFEAFEG
jgi:pimeloyl-ACP methyl ester carboxylesterase